MTIAPRHILLVDDSARDTELALDALEAYRVRNEVLALRDGAEALDYLKRRGKFVERTGESPAVILLDLKMPKVDGFEVLRQVRSDPRLKTVPVVIMTSSREERDVAKSYQLGANAYVVKPLKFQDFVEAIRRLGAFWMLCNEAPSPGGRGGSP